MWGRNIYIAFVPSILAFAFLGLPVYLDSLADLDLLPLVTWIVPIDSQSKITSSQIGEISWSDILILTSLTASMTVNALTTGLIVFRIYKVFSEVKGSITSNDKSLGITRGSRLRSIMFIIIESGMALFAIQLARVVITTGGLSIGAKLDTLSFIVSVHVMLNVIILSLISTLCFTDNWTRLGYNTYHHSGAGVNGIVFPRRTIFGRSCPYLAVCG